MVKDEKKDDVLSAEAIAQAEENLRIIKKLFKGNDPLLKAMRALFFNLPITVAEKRMVQAAFADPAAIAYIRQRFVPRLSNSQPVGQLSDVWLGAEKMVWAQSRDTIEQAIEYKTRAIAMTEVALNLLENPDGPAVELIEKPVDIKTDPLGIELLARNQYINSCEDHLRLLRLVANQEEETAIEKKKRLEKDSSR